MPAEQWVKLYEVSRQKQNPHAGQIIYRLEHKRLYSLYSRWMKSMFSASRARNIDTFYNELGKIGIVRHPKRRRINGELSRTVVDIFYKPFCKGMKLLYPSMKPNTWDSETNTVEFMKKFNGYRGKFDWIPENEPEIKSEIPPWASKVH